MEPLLGVIIFVFPPLYGEGYTALDDMMAGHSDKLLNNTYFFGFQGSAWMMILFRGWVDIRKSDCHCLNQW